MLDKVIGEAVARAAKMNDIELDEETQEAFSQVILEAIIEERDAAVSYLRTA